MARDQRRDHRVERRESCREIDVGVGEHERVAGGPRGAQGTAATLLLEVHDPHVRELRGEAVRDLSSSVGRAVVGDGDLPGEGQALEPVAQRADLTLEHVRLVEDGDDHVEDGSESGVGCGRHQFPSRAAVRS